MTWFGVGSYATASVVYGSITAFLLINHPGGRSATWIVSATAISALWAAGMALLLLSQSESPFAALVAFDAFHVFAWTACVMAWLTPSANHRKVSGRILLLSVSALLGFWAVLASPTSSSAEAASIAMVPAQSIYLALLGMSLIGLLAVEQVYRNALEHQRQTLGLLCLGIGGPFMINVFVYSQASLLHGLVPVFWEARGIAFAILGLLVMTALKRETEWARELFVSRQVAFYTASLIGVGGYLLGMGAVGYVIRAIGGHWGLLLETTFLVASLAVLTYILFSSTIRARMKVFLVKHFYRNKYDYRYEWLRLTGVLSQTGDSQALAASGLDGIAQIVGSREGWLYLAGDDGRYEQVASLESDESGVQVYDADHPIVRFVFSKGWVIDSEQYDREPDRYDFAFGNADDGVLPGNSLIVPLDCHGFLQGFICLSKPPEVVALNFEDHDILKTAGRQVAIVLAQALAQEQLTATRQFEAINKLSTFLMHDLKNLIAQQELVVSNAQRFRHRPEFIEDAIVTVRSSVERMKKILDQLQSASLKVPSRSRVDVSKVLMEVRSHCADREPVPRIDVSRGAVWVDMDRDKLTSVLTHLIRNAQDATPPTGSIDVELEIVGRQLHITVADTGKGMDRLFIRDRLFRPFDTTKGSRGMGIGAYQVRDTVRAADGDVDVQSEPGSGTKFRVRLPIIDDALVMNPPAA